MKHFRALIFMCFIVQMVRAQSPNQQNEAQIKQLTQQAFKRKQNNDYVNAAKTYLAVFNLDTTNYKAANDIADVLGDLKDYNTELIWAQKAIRLNPGFGPAYVNLGNAYVGQKKIVLAQDCYKKAAKLEPQNPYPVYALGLIEQNRGAIKHAISYYEQSQKIDSGFYDAFFNMAWCYDKLKNYNKAYQYIDRYRGINDNKEVLGLWRQVMKEIAAQPFQYPLIPATGKKPEDFVIAGWKIKSECTGDLNGDGAADAAIVLEYQNITAEKRAGNDTIYSYPRILLVLLKDGNQYKTVIQQNTFLLRAEEGDHMSGDPFNNIEIVKGILNINYEYTRSHLYYKCRYQDKDFYLIGATNAGVDHHVIFSWDFNFSTRILIHDEGESTDENDKNAKNKQEIKRLTFPKLKKLSELSEPYSWEVIKGVFI